MNIDYVVTGVISTLVQLVLNILLIKTPSYFNILLTIFIALYISYDYINSSIFNPVTSGAPSQTITSAKWFSFGLSSETK